MRELQLLGEGECLTGLVDRYECLVISEFLLKLRGNKKRTAIELGVSRRTIQYKTLKYNIDINISGAVISYTNMYQITPCSELTLDIK